ncbi:MAG: hypothetical protein WD226_09425 [Planctomycetota bacterium]
MSDREIEVTCPCCDTVLWIDVRTQKVLRRKAPATTDDFGKPKASTSWDEAHERVSDRHGKAKSKFDAGLNREQNRSQDLDDLFRKASESTRRPADEDEGSKADADS